MGYLYTLLCVAFTVVGQALIKWRLENLKSKFSTDYSTMVGGAKLFLDPIIIVALGSAFVASFFWLRAMSLLDITKAYPLTMLSPILIFVYAFFALDEKVSIINIVGLLFTIVGLILVTRQV